MRLDLSAKQGVEMFSLEADFGAGKGPEIFRQNRRIGCLAREESAEISVPSLRSNFARRHPQVSTHHGVEPENRVKNLRHGREFTRVAAFVNLFGASDGN